MSFSSTMEDSSLDDEVVLAVLELEQEASSEDLGVPWGRVKKMHTGGLSTAALLSSVNGDVLLLSHEEEERSSACIYRPRYEISTLPSWLWRPPKQRQGNEGMDCIGLCGGRRLSRCLSQSLQAWCSSDDEVVMLQEGVARTSDGISMEVCTVSGCAVSREAVSLVPRLSHVQAAIIPKSGMSDTLHACTEAASRLLYHCMATGVYHSQSSGCCGLCTQCDGIVEDTGLAVVLNTVDMPGPMALVLDALAGTPWIDVAVRGSEVAVMTSGLLVLLDFDTFKAFHTPPFVRRIPIATLTHPIAGLSYFPPGIPLVMFTSHRSDVTIFSTISCEPLVVGFCPPSLSPLEYRAYPIGAAKQLPRIAVETESTLRCWRLSSPPMDAITALGRGAVDKDMLHRLVLRAYRESPCRAFLAAQGNPEAASLIRTLWGCTRIHQKKNREAMPEPRRYSSIQAVQEALTGEEFHAFARRLMLRLVGNLPSLGEVPVSELVPLEEVPPGLPALLRPKVRLLERESLGKIEQLVGSSLAAEMKGIDKAVLIIVEELLGRLREVSEGLWEALWALRVYCCLRFRRDLRYVGRVLGIHSRVLFGGVKREQLFLLRILEAADPSEGEDLVRGMKGYLPCLMWTPSLRERGDAALDLHGLRERHLASTQSRQDLRERDQAFIAFKLAVGRTVSGHDRQVHAP